MARRDLPGYSGGAMRDHLFFPLLGLIAAGLIALALVWPQGAGLPSPPPFGHALAPLPATPPSQIGGGAAPAARAER
jgi:hypothetical protein